MDTFVASLGIVFAGFTGWFIGLAVYRGHWLLGLSAAAVSLGISILCWGLWLTIPLT